MNRDTQVKQEAPERIWVQLYESLIPECLSVNAYISDPRKVHDRGKPVYEYVRADLLATARREVFKEAIQWARKVQAVKLNAARDAASSDEFAAMRLLNEAAGAERVVESLEAALEASANQKGEMNGPTNR